MNFAALPLRARLPQRHILVVLTLLMTSLLPNGVALSVTVADVEITTRAVRPVVEFRENGTCNGFDPASDYYPYPGKGLMIREGQTNTVKVGVAPSFAIEHVELFNSAPSAITITPKFPQSLETLLTISGTSNAEAVIKARPRGGTHIFDAFLASVLPPKSHTVALHSVTNTGDGPPSNVPSYDDLTAALEQTWGKQANISFNLLPRADFSVSYDHDDNEKMTCIEDEPGTPEKFEQDRISEAEKTQNAINVYFVTSMTCPAGITHPSTRRIYVMTAGFSAAFVANTVAHELGHVLGISDEDHSDDEADLMYATTDGSIHCEVRQFDWETANGF